MNFSEKEREELEAQYEDIDPKLIQIQILMELSAIRRALTEASEGSTETRYTCKACGELVGASQRQSHLQSQHNAPPEADIQSRFTQV